jgi:hypothetical protein
MPIIWLGVTSKCGDEVVVVFEDRVKVLPDMMAVSQATENKNVREWLQNWQHNVLSDFAHLLKEAK